MVRPARNAPAAGVSTVAAAAFSAAYCELPGAPATLPLRPCGTAGLAPEPQPATTAPATVATAQAARISRVRVTLLHQRASNSAISAAISGDPVIASAAARLSNA